MNGAESLARTLVMNGVDTCFSNPGTSEMHFVAALDKVDGMRCVLGLFEGVVTGAADGYYRMTGRPACTLLHLGPGLGNGLANLHNARKARSGIVNIVGEHATYHLQHDAPLTADIQGIARPVSHWVKTAATSDSLARDCAAAIREARQPPGRIATLIAPADTAWGTASAPAEAEPAPPRNRVSATSVTRAARALDAGTGATLMLGGAALRGRALLTAGRIAAKTGCRLISEFNNARAEGGAGRVRVDRLPYPVDTALHTLRDTRALVLAGARTPVSFFAYPGKPSVLIPRDCVATELAGAEHDLEHALEALADEVGATRTAPACINAPLEQRGRPSGRVTPDGIAATLAALLPENAIVVDESVSTGRSFGTFFAGAAPHDWLNIMGGSIGWALPVATGAAIASPDRKVVAFEGDGSGMYTLQALWTMAREDLDVTVVVLANRAYQILRSELSNMGTTAGERANDMLTLDRPALDWVALARGHGVEGLRATTLEELANGIGRAFSQRGPYLIELVI